MAVALRSATHLGYASHTNSAITAPATIVSGDVLLLVGIVYTTGTTPTATPPAGFAAPAGATGGLLINDTTFNSTQTIKMYAWTKTATGSEPASYTITHTVANSDFWIASYSGVNTTTPVASFTGNSGSDTSNNSLSTALSVTPTVNGSQVVVVAADNGNTSNALSIAGTTPTFTSRIAAPVVLGILDGTLATAAATGNKTFANNSYNAAGWLAAMLVLSATATASTPKRTLMGVGS